MYSGTCLTLIFNVLPPLAMERQSQRHRLRRLMIKTVGSRPAYGWETDKSTD